MGAKLMGKQDITFTLNDFNVMRFSDLLAYASKDKTFILIGDEHTNIEISSTALSPESIAAMGKLGVKHLCLELPKQAQGEVDGYFSGKYTYEQLEKAYRKNHTPWLNDADNLRHGIELAQTLRAAKEAHIAVHFMDSNELTPLQKQHPDLQVAWKTLMSLTPAEQQPFLAGKEKEKPGFKKSLDSYMTAVITQRFAADVEHAEVMKAMAKDGKVVMFYGNDHFSKKMTSTSFLAVSVRQ